VIQIFAATSPTNIDDGAWFSTRWEPRRQLIWDLRMGDGSHPTLTEAKGMGGASGGLCHAVAEGRIKLGGMNEFHAAAREPDTRLISY
jgi:hypothetical protein